MLLRLGFSQTPSRRKYRDAIAEQAGPSNVGLPEALLDEEDIAFGQAHVRPLPRQDLLHIDLGDGLATSAVAANQLQAFLGSDRRETAGHGDGLEQRWPVLDRQL